MTAVNVALGTLIVILVGICFGVFLRMNLPERYFTDKTADTVKLSAGVIATLAALTLGLLIASAKNSYDTRVTQIRQIAANIILSDRLLAFYGEEAHAAREKLRAIIPPVTDQIWTESAPKAPKHAFVSAAESEDYVNTVYALSPKTDLQTHLRERVLQTTLEMGRARLALFAQMTGMLPPPLLVVLAFWFAVLFAAYAMHAEINVVTITALTICAASVAGAMFLLFQMNNPFSGIMAIPRVDLLAMLPPL